LLASQPCTGANSDRSTPLAQNPISQPEEQSGEQHADTLTLSRYDCTFKKGLIFDKKWLWRE